MFFVGASFAYQVGLIITAHLTKSAFPYLNVMIVPILFGTLDALGPFLQENIGLGWPSALGDGTYQIAYVFLCLGLGWGVYGSFVVSHLFQPFFPHFFVKTRLIKLQVDVIMNICEFLDIWCLTIKHPAPVEEQKKVL